MIVIAACYKSVMSLTNQRLLSHPSSECSQWSSEITSKRYCLILFALIILSYHFFFFLVGGGGGGGAGLQFCSK